MEKPWETAKFFSARNLSERITAMTMGGAPPEEILREYEEWPRQEERAQARLVIFERYPGLLPQLFS